jgi:transcriptional regulator with XRE-family HTH domain
MRFCGMADGGKSLADIGMRLQALMEALGFKRQAAFAQLIDVSQPGLNNYLKGLRRPDLDVAMRIQSKTGATLDWIYLGDRSGLPARLLEKIPDLSDLSKRAG